MKIALVHDDFMQLGGAESLFASIAALFPKAPIYTSLVDWQKLPSAIDPSRVKTSFIQKLILIKRWFKVFLPLYPLTFEGFNFDDFDLVISSTTRFSKSIVTKPHTIHICYINSIPRFLWNEQAKKEYLPNFILPLLSPLMTWLKRWDRVAASRVDYYLANSQNIKEKVKKYYGRESVVIYPFADINFYKIAKIHNWQLKSQNYFLVVSRLVKWKKVKIAIEAAKDLNTHLKIIGTGPDEKRLKKIATASQIEFVGKVTRAELRELYQNANALIVTQEEDFGIAAVEAQACGIPVIAYNAGGLTEIVEPDKTGILFKEQNKASLKDAIQLVHKVKWSQSACRKNSLRFSQAVFVKELKKFVSESIESQLKIGVPNS